MAKHHGIPGEGVRVRGTMVSLAPMFVAFACLGAFLGALVSGVGVWVNLGLFVLAAVCAVALWPRAVRRIGNYFLGARGEERVAGALSALPDGWHVFHDMAFGAFSADHVVVGPGGVFVVETKNWRGEVALRDGAILVDMMAPSRDPIEQTRHETDAVRAAVSRAGWKGPVNAVLCFASGTFAGGRQNSGSVTILNVGDLAGFIEQSAHTMPGADCERLAEILSTLSDQFPN